MKFCQNKRGNHMGFTELGADIWCQRSRKWVMPGRATKYLWSHLGLG